MNKLPYYRLIHMISNPEWISDYSARDSRLPFSAYINECRELIRLRRPKLEGDKAHRIIAANSPYEFYPANAIPSERRFKYGVLLIHGLLDCPFSLRDLGIHLQGQGIPCRSILLPGHGTRPQDLFTVTWQDWMDTLRYGVESLKKEVDHLYLAGYSTGAALSIYQALQDSSLAGIILIAPAIRIKVPINLIVTWRYLKKWLHINHLEFIDKQEEVDYTKYLSIPFNAVKQVSLLTDNLLELRKLHQLSCPMFMAVSEDDETISSKKAIHFFSGYDHPDSRLLLYARTKKSMADKRIINRSSYYPDLHIRNFSHMSLPFSADNPHYGRQGDYPFAANNGDFVYGAYNRVESDIFRQLFEYKLMKNRYRQLTYNPDFEYMANEMTKFILGS